MNLFCKLLVTCITFFASLILCNDTFAQGRWKKGYIIKTSGDTLFGKIAYVERSRVPKTIVFKQEGKDKKRYNATEISAFKVQGATQDLYYHSFTADIDVSNADLEHTSNSSQPYYQQYRFFAQLLVSGSKSLYSYVDTVVSKKHFLIEDSTQKLKDLIYKHYYLDDARTISLYNEEYKKQLGRFYSGCSTISIKSINDAGYNTTDMMKLASAYNKCSKANAETEYRYKMEKVKVVCGVDFGPNVMTMKVAAPYLPPITLHPSYSFDAGLFLNLTIPHTEKQWSIYNELLLTHYELHSDEYYPYSTVSERILIKATYLKLVTAARYQYTYSKIKPFVQVGIVNGYALSASANSPIHTPSYIPNINSFFNDFRKYEQSLFGGAGAGYKRYEAEFRYERGNGFSETTAGLTRNRYYMLLLKYAF